jgi:anti-sigma factor RsiW
VDGELDAAAAAAVGEHLHLCERCRSQATFEQNLRSQLKSLTLEEPTQDLLERVKRGARRPSFSFARWAIPAAAAIVAFVILGARSSARVLSAELLQDHVACFSRQPLEADVWGPNPDQVAGWLGEHGARIPTPPAGAAGLELIGGRRCLLPVDATVVAHLLYGNGKRRASVFVLPGTRPIDDESTVEVGARSVRFLRIGGHTVGIVADTRAEGEAFRESLTRGQALLAPGGGLTPKMALVTILVRPMGL